MKRVIGGVSRKENMNCELCKFNNPRGTATAIIIDGGKILLVRRNEKPHKGFWDLPGGYMEAHESPEQTITRELREELGLKKKYSLDFVGVFEGQALWKKRRFAIISHAFLVEIKESDIKLNRENSASKFVAIDKINPTTIAFDSNRDIVKFIKKRFGHLDILELGNLVHQLDESAVVNEQSLYRALLNGHVARVYRRGLLIGMGWIFVRQTLLRKQAVIEDMVVDERYRGRGIGRKILEQLIRWARNEGVEVIELTSSQRRIVANNLYRSAGFKLHPTNHYLLKLK